MDTKNEIIEQKIKSIILKNASLNYTENDITDNSDLVEDFKFDSMSILQLVLDIENDFKIQIEDDFLLIALISDYKSLKTYIIDIMSKKEEENNKNEYSN
ncbi:MAG: phosphopantetheine-binding protein [Oscillospiraceae bacterium]|nr:phosphopantetheine-binding protein [Oscillospiraceae bacterium]